MDRRTIGKVLVGVSLVLLVVLALVKVDSDRQGAFLCEVVAGEPTLDMAVCPAHNSSSSWLILLAFAIAIVVLIVGAYFMLVPEQQVQKAGARGRGGKALMRQEAEGAGRTQEERRAKFAEVDVSKLDAEQKKVYELLKQNGGSMYQSDLIAQTGYSKVKITRVLDRMENLEMLERRRRGMANLIVLK